MSQRQINEQKISIFQSFFWWEKDTLLMRHPIHLILPEYEHLLFIFSIFLHSPILPLYFHWSNFLSFSPFLFPQLPVSLEKGIIFAPVKTTIGFCPPQGKERMDGRTATDGLRRIEKKTRGEKTLSWFSLSLSRAQLEIKSSTIVSISSLCQR